MAENIHVWFEFCGRRLALIVRDKKSRKSELKFVTIVKTDSNVEYRIRNNSKDGEPGARVLKVTGIDGPVLSGCLMRADGSFSETVIKTSPVAKVTFQGGNLDVRGLLPLPAPRRDPILVPR